jgi:hypothetical protein
MSGNTVQITKLKKPQSKQYAHGLIQIVGIPAREMPNQEIESKLISQAAEYKLRSQPRVTGRKIGGLFQKKIRRVSAAPDLAQHGKRCASSRRYLL